MTVENQFLKTYNLLNKILVQGDSRYFDPYLLEILSRFINQKAISLAERSIDRISEPNADEIKSIEGPQKAAKYIMKSLLKQEGFLDKEIFTEISFSDNRPDLSALNKEREVFVECFSCRLSKVLDYISQDKELWVLVKGSYHWDKNPIDEKVKWFVFRKGQEWDNIYSDYKKNQLIKLKQVKSPLDR